MRQTRSCGDSDCDPDRCVSDSACNAPPTADADGPYSADEEGTVSLDSSGSSDSDGSISSCTWTVTSGPGTASGGCSGTYYAPDEMSSDATANLELTVTDNDGATDSDTSSVSVNEVNDAPAASFDYSPSSPLTGETVDFTDTSSDVDGSVSSWSWEFGDGATSSQQNPSHSYSDDGSYNVQLTVTDDDGSTDTYSQTVNVQNRAPSASFTYSPSEPDPGESTTFDASGSSDPDGSIQTYEWDWDNDGSYEGSGQTTSHTFNTGGEYSVTLRTTDDDGATDTTTQTVDVNHYPSADADGSYTVDENHTVELDGTGSSDPDGDSLSYSWTITSGPGSLSDASTSTPVYDAPHNVESDTDITVELTVSDGSLTDSDTSTVTVRETCSLDSASLNPQCGSDGCQEGETVSISGSLSPVCSDFSHFQVDASSGDCDVQFSGGDMSGVYGDSPSQDSTSVSGTWTVPSVPSTCEGDSISGDAAAVYTSGDPSSGSWESGTTSITGTVDFNKLPRPDFTYTPDNPNPGETIQFDGTSTSDPDGSIQTYRWDWTSDGSYDTTGSTPAHSYTDPGSYTVTLKVVDDDGATNTTSRTVQVNSPPTAEFTYSPSSPEYDEQVTFDASGSSDPDGSIQTYEWDWTSDGSYEGSGETATHTYDTYGTYDVTLNVTDNYGVSTTVTKTLTTQDNVDPLVNCHGCASPNPAKSGETVTFSPNPDDGDGSGIETMEVCETSSCSDTYCEDSTAPWSCSYETYDNTYEVREYHVRVTDAVGNSKTTGPFTFTVKKWVGDSCTADRECLIGECTTDPEIDQSACQYTTIPEPGIVLR
ncbi:MAG: PKD domain-containing protein [Candidatus Nanohaloarchaea archaeon]